MEDMSVYGAKFTKEHVFLNVVAQDDVHLLKIIAKKMEDLGLVTDDFSRGIIDREKIYPTGLPTKGLGVAMPHTDPVYVKEESFSVAILQKPVFFHEMGNAKGTVAVHIVFTLALKEHHTQLNMLQGIVHIIQKSELLEEIFRQKEEGRIHQMIVEELRSLSWE